MDNHAQTRSHSASASSVAKSARKGRMGDLTSQSVFLSGRIDEHITGYQADGTPVFATASSQLPEK